MRNTVTIKDVAEKAGVSISSVSRVINDSAPVSRGVREKVMRAIEQIDYIPHKYAQALKRQKTGVIGVVIPDIANPFFSQMVRGVEDIVYQNSYSIIVCDTKDQLEKENNYIDILIQERVEGVVLTSTVPENHQINKFITRKIPVVIADRPLKNANFPSVILDGFGDSYTLTKHLIDLGYREIGFIKGPQVVTTAVNRLEGYIQAMKDHGLAVRDVYMKQGEYTFESGHKAMKELLQSKKIPEAIITANDLMAIGVIRALKERGLDIPHDIGVAGFDNIPVSSWITPRLTTIDLPAYKIGQEAIKMLLSLKESKVQGEEQITMETKILKAKLIEGESCRRVR